MSEEKFEITKKFKKEVYCPFCCKNIVGVEYLNKETPEEQLLYGPICDECKEAMATGVNLFCLGIKGTYVDNNGRIIEVPCCNITTITKEVLEKHGFKEGKDFEIGGKLEIKGCPHCSPDNKYHF